LRTWVTTSTARRSTSTASWSTAKTLSCLGRAIVTVRATGKLMDTVFAVHIVVEEDGASAGL